MKKYSWFVNVACVGWVVSLIVFARFHHHPFSMFLLFLMLGLLIMAQGAKSTRHSEILYQKIRKTTPEKRKKLRQKKESISV